MYLSIGADMSVRKSSIIGIFDLDNTTCSRRGREFLERAEKSGAVIDVAGDLPRAFVLTREYGLERVYLTGFSSRALAQRAAQEQL